MKLGLAIYIFRLILIKSLRSVLFFIGVVVSESMLLGWYPIFQPRRVNVTLFKIIKNKKIFKQKEMNMTFYFLFFFYFFINSTLLH